MAMYIGTQSHVKDFSSIDPLLVCGNTCFRYLTPNNRQKICYVGSSEGAVVTQGNPCVWDFTESLDIDRGTPRITQRLK